MLLRSTFIVHDTDIARFAWANLRRFHNTDFVEDQIIRVHGLDRVQRQNVKKQAMQLRYCLVQAREYFDAAEQVSLATKPTLLYYGVMSLALAEILYKQTGDASLDRARENHKHHGLSLRIARLPNSQMALVEAATTLCALPHLKAGERVGTFDLWHRSAREMPLVGLVTRTVAAGFGTTSSYEITASPTDSRMSLVAPRGLSLFDCLSRLPCMMGHFNIAGLRSELIRGKAQLVRQDPRLIYQLTIHPTYPALFDRFAENIAVHPGAIERTQIQEVNGGATVTCVYDIADTAVFRLPASTMWHHDEAHFWTEDQPLNEFGYFYAALYILGNYARYYPDRWMQDVERGSALALAVEELLSGGASRIPLLLLSELTNTYYMRAA